MSGWESFSNFVFESGDDVAAMRDSYQCNISRNVCTEISGDPEVHRVFGQRRVVAILRIVTALLGILGSSSIIFSAIRHKKVCHPKVHPIFVLSLADLMLGVMWVSGAVLWIGGGLKKFENLRVGCFTITLITVILECVTANLTIVYALLACSTLKQREVGGVYMIQDRIAFSRVWHPVQSFLAYLIAWVLPVVMVIIPFGVIAEKHKIVECIPYFGNVIPSVTRPHNSTVFDQIHDETDYHMNVRRFVAAYSMQVTVNHLIVFFCMVFIYSRLLQRIRKMRRKGQAQGGDHQTMYGATEAMLVKGQRQARVRVLLFLTSFALSSIFTCSLGVYVFISAIKGIKHPYPKVHRKTTNMLLILEALFVPIQGFLNAIIYGWTREDFLDAMDSSRPTPRHDSFLLSHDSNQEAEEGEDGSDNSTENTYHQPPSNLLFSQSQAEGEEEEKERRRQRQRDRERMGEVSRTPISTPHQYSPEHFLCHRQLEVERMD